MTLTDPQYKTLLDAQRVAVQLHEPELEFLIDRLIEKYVHEEREEPATAPF